MYLLSEGLVKWAPSPEPNPKLPEGGVTEPGGLRQGDSLEKVKLSYLWCDQLRWSKKRKYLVWSKLKRWSINWPSSPKPFLLLKRPESGGLCMRVRRLVTHNYVSKFETYLIAEGPTISPCWLAIPHEKCDRGNEISGTSGANSLRLYRFGQHTRFRGLPISEYLRSPL